MDRLSDALGRQQEVGLMIGDELDTHIDMLDETDHLVDRTGSRLGIARRQLTKVSKGTKGCGNVFVTCTIAVARLCVYP